MKAPNVKTILRDKKQKITFVILGYRKMHSRKEALEVAYSILGKTKPKPGRTYTFLTYFGKSCRVILLVPMQPIADWSFQVAVTFSRWLRLRFS